MTFNEAQIFFPHEEGDDIYDLYETFLFEYKQFFLSKYPIKKVFEAKEKKMFQMHEAYLILGGKFEINKKIFPIFEEPYSELILDTFNRYQKSKNELKIRINQAVSATEISHTIQTYLHLQKKYLNCWPEIEISQEEKIIFSKEPDPMEVLNSIQEFKNVGGILFSDLITKRNISPELLINEAKRLSLCRKLEQNG